MCEVIYVSTYFGYPLIVNIFPCSPSGAHMNPALTLAFAAAKRLPWKKVPVYWTAQLLGAFVASACVYGVYYGECKRIIRWIDC